MPLGAQGVTDMVRRLRIVFNYQYLHGASIFMGQSGSLHPHVRGRGVSWQGRKSATHRAFGKLIFGIGFVTQPTAAQMEETA
jgi:hypothetical protein